MELLRFTERIRCYVELYGKCGVCDATKNVWNVLHSSHRPRVAMNHGFCA